MLLVNATGVWLCVLRLHRGGFVWPQAGDGLMPVSAEQLAWLLMGVAWLIPSVDWLLYSAVHKQALQTSQIEGTHACLANLLDH